MAEWRLDNRLVEELDSVVKRGDNFDELVRHTYNGLVDLEDQLISSDVIEDLSKVFSAVDNLFIVMHISKNPDGSLYYMEYPGIPVVTSINKSTEVKLAYWRCFSSRVEFGFWLNGTPGVGGVEFASVSTGKLTIPKSREKLELLKNEGWETEPVQESDFDVGEEIDVSKQESGGIVRAVFKKSGRAHDVDIGVEAD